MGKKKLTPAQIDHKIYMRDKYPHEQQNEQENLARQQQNIINLNREQAIAEEQKREGEALQQLFKRPIHAQPNQPSASSSSSSSSEHSLASTSELAKKASSRLAAYRAAENMRTFPAAPKKREEENGAYLRLAKAIIGKQDKNPRPSLSLEEQIEIADKLAAHCDGSAVAGGVVAGGLGTLACFAPIPPVPAIAGFIALMSAQQAYQANQQRRKIADFKELALKQGICNLVLVSDEDYKLFEKLNESDRKRLDHIKRFGNLTEVANELSKLPNQLPNEYVELLKNIDKSPNGENQTNAANELAQKFHRDLLIKLKETADFNKTKQQEDQRKEKLKQVHEYTLVADLGIDIVSDVLSACCDKEVAGYFSHSAKATLQCVYSALRFGLKEISEIEFSVDLVRTIFSFIKFMFKFGGNPMMDELFLIKQAIANLHQDMTTNFLLVNRTLSQVLAELDKISITMQLFDDTTKVKLQGIENQLCYVLEFVRRSSLESMQNDLLKAYEVLATNGINQADINNSMFAMFHYAKNSSRSTVCCLTPEYFLNNRNVVAVNVYEVLGATTSPFFVSAKERMNPKEWARGVNFLSNRGIKHREYLRNNPNLLKQLEAMGNETAALVRSLARADLIKDDVEDYLAVLYKIIEKLGQKLDDVIRKLNNISYTHLRKFAEPTVKEICTATNLSIRERNGEEQDYIDTLRLLLDEKDQDNSNYQVFVESSGNNRICYRLMSDENPLLKAQDLGLLQIMRIGSTSYRVGKTLNNWNDKFDVTETSCQIHFNCSLFKNMTINGKIIRYTLRGLSGTLWRFIEKSPNHKDDYKKYYKKHYKIKEQKSYSFCVVNWDTANFIPQLNDRLRNNNMPAYPSGRAITLMHVIDYMMLTHFRYLLVDEIKRFPHYLATNEFVSLRNQLTTVSWSACIRIKLRVLHDDSIENLMEKNETVINYLDVFQESNISDTKNNVNLNAFFHEISNEISEGRLPNNISSLSDHCVSKFKTRYGDNLNSEINQQFTNDIPQECSLGVIAWTQSLIEDYSSISNSNNESHSYMHSMYNFFSNHPRMASVSVAALAAAAATAVQVYRSIPQEEPEPVPWYRW